MLGQLVFAELPFASFGDMPYVERGWIKDCPEKSDWVKQPTEAPKWQLVGQSVSGWAQRPTEVSQWQLADRSVSDWDKKNANDVNTIECGDFKPTNIPGLKN